MKKVGIIGAGISGLYLANIFKNHSGFNYKIFEKRKNFNFSKGYGIQLSVNSIKLLNKIGFKSLPASEVFFPSRVNFFQSNNSKKICDIDLTQFNDSLNRYTTTKRSTLLKFLLENIPQDKIKFNTSLSYLDYSNDITVHFSDKSKENFDFLVIADGVFSQSKLIISEDSIRPKFNNSIALRGKLNKYDDNNISIFMGSDFHYVIYPVNQNNEYNFIAIFKKKLTDLELNNEINMQSEVFVNSLKKILSKKSLINLENLTEIQAFPIYVSKSLPPINKKNIFYSGDALFAFSPSFAQGASQSIETAQEIFDSITNQTDNLYKNRVNRINSINLRSKINNFAFHLSNPINVFIRNIILKYISKNKIFLQNYLGKIYKN